MNTDGGIKHVCFAGHCLVHIYTISHNHLLPTYLLKRKLPFVGKQKAFSLWRKEVAFRQGLSIKIVMRITVAIVGFYRNDYNVVCPREQPNLYVHRQDKSVGFLSHFYIS